MPKEGVKLLHHNDILSFDEIVEVVQYGVDRGIRKVRITGGEPLVRKGIINLVAMLSQLKGIEDLSMTTNGLLLPSMAMDLKNAGLNRINISLDTLDAEHYRIITRGGDISVVLQGIEAAKMAGLFPIKLNAVLPPDRNKVNALEVREFAAKNGLESRFIHQMSLEKGEFSIVEGGEGGDCKHCNRMRLTSDGFLAPCLFNPLRYNIRTLGIEQAWTLALANKPLKGTSNSHETFNHLGG